MKKDVKVVVKKKRKRREVKLTNEAYWLGQDGMYVFKDGVTHKLYEAATDKTLEGKDFTAYSKVHLDENGEIKVEPITESIYKDALEIQTKYEIRE